MPAVVIFIGSGGEEGAIVAEFETLLAEGLISSTPVLAALSWPDVRRVVSAPLLLTVGASCEA